VDPGGRHHRSRLGIARDEWDDEVGRVAVTLPRTAAASSAASGAPRTGRGRRARPPPGRRPGSRAPRCAGPAPSPTSRAGTL
jgi:hypothetical protein